MKKTIALTYALTLLLTGFQAAAGEFSIPEDQIITRILTEKFQVQEANASFAGLQMNRETGEVYLSYPCTVEVSTKGIPSIAVSTPHLWLGLTARREQSSDDTKSNTITPGLKFKKGTTEISSVSEEVEFGTMGNSTNITTGTITISGEGSQLTVTGSLKFTNSYLLFTSNDEQSMTCTGLTRVETAAQ